MSDMYHPTADRLEAFAEGLLDQAERVVIESHVLGCPHCQTQIDEWRVLFTALSGLPQFEPSSGFADRVMARVRVAPASRRTAWQSAWGWASGRASAAGAAAAGMLPRTTYGWAMVTAFLALPVIAGGAFVTWLLSRSYLTPETLWVYISTQVVDAVRGVGTAALSAILQADVVAWLVTQAGYLVENAGATGVGAILAAVSAATMLSVWVLYRNLIRTPSRGTNYVTFSL